MDPNEIAWRGLCEAQYSIYIADYGNDGQEERRNTDVAEAQRDKLSAQLAASTGVPALTLRGRAMDAAYEYGQQPGVDGDPDVYRPPDWNQLLPSPLHSRDTTDPAEVNTRAHELEEDYFFLMDQQNIWDDDSPRLDENIADIERQRDEFLMKNRALLGGNEHWRGYYEDLDRGQPVSEMNHEALVAQEATLVTSLARNKPPVVAGLLATSQAALMEAQRRLTKATLDVKGAVEQLDGISRWAFRQRKAQGALVVGLEATQNRRLGDRDAVSYTHLR